MSIKNKIAKATLIITVFAILGKFLGMVREIIIAAKFGTTISTDAFFLGLIGPESIRDIISGGVLATVFIPVYSKLIAKSSLEDARKFVSTIAIIIFIALAIAVVVGIPLAPYFIKMIAPEIDIKTLGMATDVSRIVFPSILFMGLASFLGSMLNVNKHFLAPALNQTLLNVGIICGVAFLGYKYGINSLAIGFLAGAILQFIITMAALKSNSISFILCFEWSDEMKKMFKLWFLFLLASLAAMANDLVSRSLAAGLETGNISAIIFSNRIRETVWLLCAVPIGTAVFPYLSENAAFKEKEEFSKIFIFSLRLTIFMAFPACLIMLFFSTQIVQLLFERGVFDASSTKITAQALYYFSFGTLFYALNFIVFKVYYSSHNAVLPLKVFCIAFLINLFSGILLRKYLSVGGIALARSLSDIFVFIYLLLSVKRVSVDLDFKNLSINVLKICLASLIGAGISYLIYTIIPQEKNNLELVFRLGGAVLSGIICYIGIGLMFKVQEINSIWKVVKQKLIIR